MKYNLNNVICIRGNKTIYRDGDYSIKVFEDDIAPSKILNEALNQQRAFENTDINVPKLIEITKIDNKWAIVSEYIEGITLEQYLQENPNDLDNLLQLFVGIQLEILNNRIPLLTRLKEKFRDKLKTTNLIEDSTKYELMQRLEGFKNHNKLCHGDLSLSNVIVKEDSSIWVLDWAHATQGNASADAARTYLTLSLKGKTDLANKYLEVFSEKSNIPLNNIQRWIPIVAATELTKNKTEEKEILHKWIDVVDYE